MTMMQRGCELCDGVAALYCAADEAHICWTCDEKVHSANFLVARHTRLVLCTTCGIPTPWRASGANPTPLTGLCGSCSQEESQGECTTLTDGSVVDSRRVASLSVVGRTLSGYESGCSSSNSQSCNGKIAEGHTVCASPCESASQLSSEDVDGVTVDSSRSVEASVSLGISKSAKRKRLDCCAPAVSGPQNKQIATRALGDVNRSVAHRQCECDIDITTSSSPISRIATHALQDPTFGGRDWNRPQSHVLGYNQNSHRGLSSLVLPLSKRQRLDNRAPMRLSFPQSSTLSISRLMRTLAKWHWDLHLSSPGTVPLAFRLFRKVSRALAPAVLSNAGTRVTLAVCLRLACGLDQAQIIVPDATEVAACAGISTRRLSMTEIHLLALLGWRRIPS